MSKYDKPFLYPTTNRNNPWCNPIASLNKHKVPSMPVIAVKQILIKKNRQRQEFDPEALQELSLTIVDKGLMHAIVLRKLDTDDTEEAAFSKTATNGMCLVAGERRLRAIQDMWMLGGVLKYNDEIIQEGFVPYTNLGDLTPLEAEEAELEENLRRKDLTWQEQAAATGKLHKIRGARAATEGRVHTVLDTAMEKSQGKTVSGSAHEATRREIIVEKHLDNPVIAKAKSVDEAFKILKKQEEFRKHSDLAVAVGATFSSELHEAHNVNCLEWMAKAEPSQFDVILTDPPYGMDAQTFGDGGGGRLTNNEHHYDDSLESWTLLMSAWCPLAYRIAKPQAHAYVFCDIDNFHALRELMRKAGWYVFRTPFICCKPNSGRVPLPDEGPRRQYETCLYAIKGHKHTTGIYPDVISTFADGGFNHGAQKPVALFENLLQRSVRPGDLVLDSFAGTGTVFPAASKFQCKAVGLEQEKTYYGMCLKRLEELAKPSPVAEGLDSELAGMLGIGGAA